ncbi:MAG: hypothetical protein OQL19_19925, partial [Gammaproteobacteria bacterium]|nr:hypothetical protein [Gammaproteobacteria bacterium]
GFAVDASSPSMGRLSSASCLEIPLQSLLYLTTFLTTSGFSLEVKNQKQRIKPNAFSYLVMLLSSYSEKCDVVRKVG